MIFRSLKANNLILLVMAFLLVSCQSKPVLPTVTVQVTLAGKTLLPAITRTVPQVTPSPSVIANSIIPDLSSLKGKTILFWHPWSGDLAGQVDQVVSDFNQHNQWGIQVKVQPLYSAGALYDAVQTGGKGDSPTLPVVVAATSEQLTDWSAHGVSLVNLNEYITQPQVGMTETEIKGYQPVFWAQDQAGDIRLGIPALRTAQVIFYNQTWAKQLGFQNFPKTPEEFQQQACAAAKYNTDLHDKNVTGTGGWLIDNDALTTLSWLSAFGAKPIPDTEGQPYTFESKASESAVTFLRGMLDRGCAWLGRNPMPYQYFTQRMALFYTGSLSNVFTQSRYQTQLKSKDQWTVLPFPGEDGKPIAYANGYSYALFKAKDPQTQLAGWLFIHWMEQPATAVKLAKALPSLPVNNGIADLIGSSKNEFPWELVMPLSNAVRPAPSLSTWRTVQRLLQDASWQIYQLPAEGLDKILPQTLPELDAAVQDAIKNKSP